MPQNLPISGAIKSDRVIVHNTDIEKGQLQDIPWMEYQEKSNRK